MYEIVERVRGSNYYRIEALNAVEALRAIDEGMDADDAPVDSAEIISITKDGVALDVAETVAAYDEAQESGEL